MYKSWFELSESPFSISPNPAFLYMSRQHQEALAHLIYGMQNEGGIILLTGEVGTGKTTISRKLLEQLPDEVDLAWVINPKLSALELLATLCDELHIAYDEQQSSIKTFTDLISDHLLKAHAKGRNTVLMIDEAQNLMPDVLEQLRLLTNLETHERKLLQIILIGQPELQDILKRHDLRQFSQRITARFHLLSLNEKETEEYIQHRLQVAGSQRKLFARRSIRLIHRISEGIPRRINLICDRALLGAYAQSLSMVTPALVRTAVGETLGHEEPGFRWSWWKTGIPISAAALLMLGFVSNPLQPALLNLVTTPGANTIQATTSTQRPVANTGEISTTIKATAPRPVESDTLPTDTPMDASSPIAMADHDSTPRQQPAIIAPESAASELTSESGTQTESKAENELDIWQAIASIATPEATYQTLAAQWGIELPASEKPCDELAKQHMQCMRQRAGLAQLRDLNRPAIVRLHADGRDILAVITALSGQSVLLQINEHKWHVPIDEFEQHWYADFTLLWKTPPGFEHPIRPGNQGMAVEWLAQQLDQIQGTMIPPRKFTRMSPLLVERLKDFQHQSGLKADGAAGPQTLIRINDAIGLPRPRLNQS